MNATTRTRDISLVRVFPDAQAGNASGKLGGNPAPIVLDAAGMGEEEMRAIAARYGHESGFVMPATTEGAQAGADIRMRYFVPAHEMEMCGHATVGALWLMRRSGQWDGSAIRIQTASGLVRGQVSGAGSPDESIEITQPPGRVEAITDAALLARIAQVLCVDSAQLLPLPVLNSATSRVKTLIGLKSVTALHALQPDFAAMRKLCEAIGSTGLYPWAQGASATREFHARQFPKSSGYPEDAATGIAAAALLFGLHTCGVVPADAQTVLVHQGEAMGAPSLIRVRFDLDAKGDITGCLLGGAVAQD